MRILVCGGRDFTNAALVDATLDALYAARPFGELIEGGARGADRLAALWASRNRQRVALLTVPALWSEHGRAAGAIRNERMLALKPDLVVAFPGGAGTAHMVRIAREAGVEVREIVEADSAIAQNPPDALQRAPRA